MKIVIFKNGKYGVRKWGWFDKWGWLKPGYVYAIEQTGASWRSRSSAWRQAQEFDTLDIAENVIAAIKEKDDIEHDKGIPL